MPNATPHRERKLRHSTRHGKVIESAQISRGTPASYDDHKVKERLVLAHPFECCNDRLWRTLALHCGSKEHFLYKRSYRTLLQMSREVLVASSRRRGDDGDATQRSRHRVLLIALHQPHTL